ncbi:MAG: hypothetical protein ACI9R3_002596 [Verrucomicrobiales bacterium]|jgi:hypothetical protein
MAQFQVTRTNNEWETFWQEKAASPPPSFTPHSSQSFEPVIFFNPALVEPDLRIRTK